jgi:hypothetical protein
LTEEPRPAIFEDKPILRADHQEAWWYSVVDVVAVFASAGRARKLLGATGGTTQLYDFIVQLKTKVADGKHRSTELARIEARCRTTRETGGQTRVADP